MSDCVLCACEDKQPSKDNCQTLHQENDAKIRDFAIMYRDASECVLQDYGAKGFYNVWCMFRNLIAQVCWILQKANFVKYQAGDNITFDVDEEAGITTINATATESKTYTAGEGISISDEGVISNTKADQDISGLLSKTEASQIYQPKLTAGSNISISGNTISAVIPPPEDVDLSDYVKTSTLTSTLQNYVPLSEYNSLKTTLQKIITNLETSGAWSGGLQGNFTSNRNIATGNINIFGGTQDGNSFIRTNNGTTENDLAGGI